MPKADGQSKKQTVNRSAAAQPKQKAQSQAQPKTQSQTQQKTQSQTQQNTQSQAQQKAQSQAQQKAQSQAQQNTQPKRRGRPPKNAGQNQNTSPVKISFIGGLNEIGKNVTMYEYGDDAILVDCGMAFPDDTMLGIDIVLPDFTYVEKNKDKLRGVLITHGHEDHIGAIPYLLKRLNVPLYGTRLTLGLLEGKLREHNLLGGAKMNPVAPGQHIKLGGFDVEFINVNHSIPAAVALAIKTGAGTIIQTGDFKIDMTPIHGDIIDLGRFAQLGKEGVLCLLSDSTNAERPGFTPSERTVGEAFNRLFQSAQASDRRIVVATFASNVYRVQQIIDSAARFGRKVAISGRSMVNTVTIGKELGYLKIPDGILVDLSAINRYPKNKMVLITTGSQGEPMSALTRMAFNDHRQVSIGLDDFIIISATPIPGNEKTVGNVVNELLLKGCEVVYEKMYDVHVSGHACQEELKIILGMTDPKYFIPVHGEQKHLQKHAALARTMGIPQNRIMIADLGDCVEVGPNSIKQAGKVPSGRVLVDGLGVGDVGGVVLRDRKHLGQDGLIIAAFTVDSVTGEVISGPDVISRGFVYVRESEPLMAEARDLVRDIIDEAAGQRGYDRSAVKTRIRDDLSRMLYTRTRRSPMILPIIMEV
ncbi:MAG: ribonuclease J [Oscillospiraceae bacterium]|nr:ribonuclease J [Oscillospiraceae bacterium]